MNQSKSAHEARDPNKTATAGNESKAANPADRKKAPLTSEQSQRVDEKTLGNKKSPEQQQEASNHSTKSQAV